MIQHFAVLNAIRSSFLPFEWAMQTERLDPPTQALAILARGGYKTSLPFTHPGSFESAFQALHENLQRRGHSERRVGGQIIVHQTGRMWTTVWDHQKLRLVECQNIFHCLSNPPIQQENTVQLSSQNPRLTALIHDVTGTSKHEIALLPEINLNRHTLVALILQGVDRIARQHERHRDDFNAWKNIDRLSDYFDGMIVNGCSTQTIDPPHAFFYPNALCKEQSLIAS